MSVPDFSRLLDESRQLSAKINATGHGGLILPPLRRGLEELDVASGLILSQHPPLSRDEAKATLLLAAKGFDIEEIASDIKDISPLIESSGNGPSVTSCFANDLDSLLQAEMENVVIDALDRLNHQVWARSEEVVAQREKQIWEEDKKLIRIGNQKVLGSTELKTKNAPKVESYAMAIAKFNEARLRGLLSNLPREFEASQRQVLDKDPRSEMLLDCWRALQVILKTSEGDNIFVCKDINRAYQSPKESPAHEEWCTQLTKGSRAFLESVYLRFVEKTLAQYPRDVILGGRPSTMERVRAFCDIRLKRMSPSELVNVEVTGGCAPWMVIFYLLRCGLFKEALSFAQTLEAFLLRTEPRFIPNLRSYVSDESGLSESAQGALRHEYMQKLTGSTRQDPFKMATLKIIGRCDLARKTVADVVLTSEDYIWLQLCLVQEQDSNYQLSDLQRLIETFGVSHFDPKQNNPLHYFEILMLVGLFEKAIEHLYTGGLVADAVHFAIAMSVAGVLRLHPQISDPIFNGEAGINLAAMLIAYSATNFSAASESINAINYTLLLTLSGVSQYDSQCHASLRELILQSGDYTTLLGDVRSDGTVIPGLLAQYATLANIRDERAFMDLITASAAAKCEQDGRFREALQLYNLASKFDKVLDVLNARLARAFASPYSAIESEELRRTAQSILEYYGGHPHISTCLNSALLSTCHILLQLLAARKLTEELSWVAALSILQKMNFLPLEGDVSEISIASDRIRTGNQHFSTLLPEMLVLAMTVIVRRFEELGKFIGVDTGRAQQADMLKRMARNLMTFSGMMRLYIPQDTFARLTRLEVSLS